jgi:hypothetical protein
MFFHDDGQQWWKHANTNTFHILGLLHLTDLLLNFFDFLTGLSTKNALENYCIAELLNRETNRNGCKYQKIFLQ